MIELAVKEWVEGSAEVVAIVGDRISLDVAEDTQGAYLVITKINGMRPTYLDGSPRQSQALVQIDAYSLNAIEVRELSEHIVSLFQSQGIQIAGHDIQWVGLDREPKPSYESATKLRRVLMEFRFYYH